MRDCTVVWNPTYAALMKTHNQSVAEVRRIREAAREESARQKQRENSIKRAKSRGAA